MATDIAGMMKFRKDHPYRPVFWRWERSRLLCERGGNPLPGGVNDEDIITRKAAKYRRMRDACTSIERLEQLNVTFPDIFTAHTIYVGQNGPDKDDHLRCEIEARILAQEPLEDIDLRRQLRPGTTRCYEQLFFNVMDRIDNKSYIFHSAIGGGTSVHSSLGVDDYGVLWKMYGYVRGLEMLEFIIYTFADWYKPHGADQIMEALNEDYRHTLKRKVTIAARSIPVNHHTQTRLIELQSKIAEIEAQSGDGDAVHMQNNIVTMFSCLKLAVGIPVTGMLEGHNMNTAALRASEMIAAAAGRPPDMRKIANMKFPEKDPDDEEPEQQHDS